MEAIIRKPFQGVSNIIRFNWHFYVIAAAIICLLFLSNTFIPHGAGWMIQAITFLILLTIVVSLLVSFYVYDLSGLYQLDWLNHLKVSADAFLVNINAGFDETSVLIKAKYPSASLRVVDFYDPEKHTEVSIKRARKAYSVYKGTESITTKDPFLQNDSVDFIFLILSAHEIRNAAERTYFFTHLGDSLKPEGSIIVVEHVRNLPNFLAYNIGFFHFYSDKSWKTIFGKSGLAIDKEKRITPFIVSYTLKKNGTAS